MRRFVVVVVLVLVVAISYRTLGSPETGTGGTLTLPGPSPNAGQPAETFIANRYDSGTFRLSDEGVYVVTFWSNLNQDSNQARPYFTSLAEDYEGEGARFAAVYLSTIPEGESEAPYAVLQDLTGNLSSYYNVKQIPRLFVISDGEIALVQNDFFPENTDEVREVLDRELEAQQNQSAVGDE